MMNPGPLTFQKRPRVKMTPALVLHQDLDRRGEEGDDEQARRA
jgi:hypothetical protein